MAKIVNTEKKKPSRRKRIFFIIAGIVVLAGLAVLWARLYGPLRPVEDTAPDIEKSAATIQKAQQVSDEWSIANNETDYTKGEAELQKKLTDSTTNERRAGVYLQLAALAINNDNPNDALKYAQDAENAHPTDLTAQMLGDANASKGDKVAAEKYYNLAIQRIGDPNDDDMKAYMITEVKSRIQALEE